MGRRIAITPGNGSDYIGAFDTEAKDSSGNAISAQAFALLDERGNVAGDVTALLTAIVAGVNLTNKLLIMQGKRPHKAKG